MLKIEKAGTDADSLTGKADCEGVYVTLEDGSKGFFSWKSLRNYVVMKTAMKNGKAPAATPLFDSAAK